MQIKIPEVSLILLMGPSSAGKSTFAQKHFLPSEIVSSDQCRLMVEDDENSKDATNDAFELLHYIVSKRLKRGKLTVVDATNVQKEARAGLLQVAKKHHCLAVILAINTPLEVCIERNKTRSDRDIKTQGIKAQHRNAQRALRFARKDGFRYVHKIDNPDEVTLIREPLWNNKKHETGPFDIIGDVHGCFVELRILLTQLGYKITKHRNRQKNYGYTVKAPEGRRVILVGDLTDRGPASNEVLRLVMSMVKNEQAFCICGNHDDKLLRYLLGKNVKLTHGLDLTAEQLRTESPEFIKLVIPFLKSLVSHCVLDEGKLVVAHAGLKEKFHGRSSRTVRSFCLYGDTEGKKDAAGMIIRQNWAADYRGKALVVYGHVALAEAERLNNTINIDSGCVFGGKLTALRYPENELVETPALKVYAKPQYPLTSLAQSTGNRQKNTDNVLDIEDVMGKRLIETKLLGNVTIWAENSIAALETMSRFAIDPKKLIYLPPTMSPCATSKHPDYLERPEEAFEYFQKNGIQQVVCEEKHMGSRAVIMVAKDEAAYAERFKVENAGCGVCYTRTGRAFFDDKELEQAFLKRLQKALTKTHFWKKMETDWVALDCELMPWSMKAQALLRNQYAAVGAAAQNSIVSTLDVLKKAAARGVELAAQVKEFEEKNETINKYVTAYQQYCWEVDGLDDFKLAPFHILATEGQTHFGKNHQWHMDNIAHFCAADPQMLLATSYKVVDLQNNKQKEDAISWWENLTTQGGEGMVIKPYGFTVKGKQGLLQPAVKCRGREYLRIIYGPEYTNPAYLQRLKKRGLRKKRNMALKEFALGVEGLQRFVNRESIRNVHECVFGVLAFESEAVDPRL